MEYVCDRIDRECRKRYLSVVEGLEKRSELIEKCQRMFSDSAKRIFFFDMYSANVE